MIYLVDGYNVLFKTIENIDPLEISRNQLIEFLEAFFSSINKKAIIVFDARSSDENFIPSKKFTNFLEIVYSPSDQTADQYIIDHVSNHPKDYFTVVTSDKDLSYQVKRRNTKIMSSKALVYKMLENQSTSVEKPQTVTPAEKEYLLKKMRKSRDR